METGTLFIISTPIGNLEDITLRALRILKEVDYVLCEDTRVTGKLLHHHSIKAKMKRYDAHTSTHTHDTVLEDLSDGKQIALVSDAGTPGISDPGVLLVERARKAGARIEVIPGASSVTAAVSIAGIAGNQFTFLGFIPHKKGRETFIKNLPNHAQPAVFLESTHRILKLLNSVEKELPTAKVYLARELTKLHEELLIGTATELLTIFEANPVKQKGEFVVLVEVK